MAGRSGGVSHSLHKLYRKAGLDRASQRPASLHWIRFLTQLLNPDFCTSIARIARIAELRYAAGTRMCPQCVFSRISISARLCRLLALGDAALLPDLGRRNEIPGAPDRVIGYRLCLGPVS